MLTNIPKLLRKTCRLEVIKGQRGLNTSKTQVQKPVYYLVSSSCAGPVPLTSPSTTFIIDSSKLNQLLSLILLHETVKLLTCPKIILQQVASLKTLLHQNNGHFTNMSQ